MIEFEEYKKNLHTEDKHGIKDVAIKKSSLCRSVIGKLKRSKNEMKNDRKQPLAAAIVGVNNTCIPLPENTDYFNPWTHVDAQELFLNSKPTCYIILGKPGAGAYTLGEEIEKQLHCIHLCPKNILIDEIEQNSATGKCVDFNMRNDKVISFETFFKMLRVKLKSAVIQHRGYIISGFPLVTCTNSPQYFINPLSGEEAVLVVEEILYDTIANLKKKKKRKRRSSTSTPGTSFTSDTEPVDEEVEEEEEEEKPEEDLPEEEEEELKIVLPKFLLDTCYKILHPTPAHYNTKKIVLLQQLNDLFSLKLKPDIILYLGGPDKDIVLKKSHKYINYKAYHNIVVEPFDPKISTDIRWPVKYTTSEISPCATAFYKSKYFVRQPMNFLHNSVEQMCNYRQEILPFLDKKFMEFDPKFVIRIDSRLSLQEIMQEVSARINTIATKPVIIPKPLRMEEPPEELEKFWRTVKELDVIHSGAANFYRSASPWSSRCPVELKKRVSVIGKPKLAIAFLKNIYLTASLDNLIAFYKNPRPFLKLKYLEPTCRIIVVGTKLSGKTMISECLSWLFDAPVINYGDIYQSEVSKKYDIYAKSVLSEIIATIEDKRHAVWQSEEMERIANIDKWCKTTQASLKKYIGIMKVYLRRKKEKADQAEGASTIDAALINNLNIAKSSISFLPYLDNLNECENALSADGISKYVPKELTSPKQKPKLPVLGDKDVTKAITAYIETNDLQNEIIPSVEEIVSLMKDMISLIDAEHQKRTNMDEMYGKYIIDGFPSNIDYWNALEESKLLPDYTVALLENREIEPDLLEHYKVISKCTKYHKERYLLANDPLIKTKLNIQTPREVGVLEVKLILRKLIDNSSSNNDIGTDQVKKSLEDIPETEPWLTFGETIDKIKEEWDSIKLKLEENDKCFIEVQLENKTDIKIVEEIMLKLRKCYYLACEINEDEEYVNEEEDVNASPKDIFTYNNSQNYGETGIYCPMAYYDYGVLWEGKPEFSVKFDDKLYRLCNETNLELFKNDVTKYQAYNKPFKMLPPLRICVIGSIASGKTTISKLLAKELGLMHIDFSEVVNTMLLPTHSKKVGRRYENSFTDAAIDDEAVVEFQMDEANENLISDIMSNETELRRMVYNYFERGSQILPQLMQKLITKLWFADPFVSNGFILDGYPKLPSDLEDMVSCYCIPDLIIELESSSETVLERMSSKMFQTWKMQLIEAKERAKSKLKIEKQEWLEFLSKNIVVKLILDEVLDKMFFMSEPTKEVSVDESVIIDSHPSGSVIDANLFNTYNEMIQVFPEPVDHSEWEKADEVRERITSRLEGIFESDDENIQALKEVIMEQRIKIASIDGNKSITKVTRLALSKLTNLRNRNKSFFENTIIVTTDLAETLITKGLCFTSNKFNKMAPVHIYQNPNFLINFYNISKLNNEVFPVVHRSYVYFICEKENLIKFRMNPLKYIANQHICEFIEYPLRIGIIGAPKSGKSTIAGKLAKRYGLICLSKGIAVRYILDTKYWTELGTTMLAALAKGECISTYQIMKAVQATAMAHRTVTNGYVFDGFPETASEAMELDKYGIYPNIMIDVSSDKKYIVESSQKEIYHNLLKIMPPYSRPLIENIYENWKEGTYNLRDWIQSDYQNLYPLDGNQSKWKCLDQAINIIKEFIRNAHNYLANVNTNIVPAHFMCISNKEFNKRCSSFHHVCPLCLRQNRLSHNENPVVKKGVLQFKDKFYWVCPEHLDIVMKNPEFHLKPKKKDLPERPLIVKRVNMSLIYEKGICIVTYAEHLPGQLLVMGTSKYACSYSGNRYLFCSKECLEKFLAKPHLYYDISVFQQAEIKKSLPLNSLPIIGYLEQTVAVIITEACISVTVHRPKYPGLTFQLSALLHIALYLKTHNPSISTGKLEMYNKASTFFDARCKLLNHVGLYLRSMDNPFANYPKCCRYDVRDTELTGDHSGSSSRRSLVSSRSSNI